MSAAIGYKKGTLEDFYEWQGVNGSPAVGTVNYILGYNSSNPFTKRYTYPDCHKDSTVQLDNEGMPIIGTVVGDEQEFIWKITANCPESKKPPLEELLTQDEVDALNWFN